MMNKTTITNDGLITAADVQAFKDEVNRGRFRDQVHEMMDREPELAFYISERHGKTLDSLQEAGIEGRRLAALNKHISLMTWGSAVLVTRAQRRQWDGFLPSHETTQEGGGQ
jgi:hypothetical protein